MRDIVSAPIFMRLGRRMRTPEGRPIGTLKRVIISNIVCSGSVSGLGSVISGIPGHYIEDVKISNVQVLHQGGGTKEAAAYQPPEYEDFYPEPDMFVGAGRGQAATAVGRTARLSPKGRGAPALEEARRPGSSREEALWADRRQSGTACLRTASTSGT